VKHLLIALKATLLFTLITGAVYPLLVTGLAKGLFRHQAAGSMLQAGGRTVGSEWIGQSFTRPGYFHGRPSAAGNDGYDGLSSGGSNLGPTSQKLADRTAADIKKFRAENPAQSGPLPADAVTASGSGLDPHISPETAEAQVARVAATRGMGVEAVRQLVAAHTAGRQFGFLGEPRVNVLQLNLELDRAAPVAAIK
jgi:K+-transporting ATPase ATPase C chain